MSPLQQQRALAQQRVDELLEFEFESTANWAATQLRHGGNCYVQLCPGDSTKYEIGILQWHNFNGRLQPGYQDRWFMAHTFGPLYEWGGGAPVHWSYVRDKWVPGNTVTQDYTAMVLTRFLNTLSPILPRSTDPEL